MTKPKVGRSLAEMCPELKEEWNYEKNGELTPQSVSAGSKQKVWWKCSKCGHEWQAQLNNRSRGTGCPRCGLQRRVVKRSTPEQKDSLASVNPVLASEWNYEKNGSLTPSDVFCNSQRKVWWKCEKGHEWQATIANRNYNHSECPLCTASGTSYPEQFIYWALKQIYANTKNRYKTPNNIEFDIFVPDISLCIEYSGKYWHKGKETLSEFKRNQCLQNNYRFYEILEQPECLSLEINQDFAVCKPYDIQGLVQIVDYLLAQFGHSINDIDFELVKNLATEYSKGKIEFEKSLAYINPNLAYEWHPTLNGDITALDVTPSSHRTIWWLCGKGHEWQAEVASRNIGNGCPVCNNKKVISGFNDLASKFPDIAAEWHPTLNGDTTPETITSHSGEKYWWKCMKCGHEWEAKVSNRTSRHSGCPKCKAANLAKRNACPPPGESLADRYPNLALEWHPSRNEGLTPSDVRVSSNKKVWWQCHKCGHEWMEMIYYRTARNKGCPICNMNTGKPNKK